MRALPRPTEMSDAGSFDWSADDRRRLDSLQDSPRTATPPSSSGRRTRRGGRRWRGGTPPDPPAFTRDLQHDPHGWRKYTRSVRIWQQLVSPYLPKSEQALRLLNKITDEAALILEFDDIKDFYVDGGIDVLLGRLEPHFNQRQINTLAEDLIAFENFNRSPGETIAKAITRMLVLETRLRTHQIPLLPDKVRTVKLLRAMKLDERGVQSVLSSTGNILRAT